LCKGGSRGAGGGLFCCHFEYSTTQSIAKQSLSHSIAVPAPFTQGSLYDLLEAPRHFLLLGGGLG